MHDIDSFRETLSLGVRQIFFVSLPFVAWFVAVPHSIVQLIYQHGAFVAIDTAAVAPILAFFTLGMAFANVNIMFNRGFQSLQRPWLPLYVAVINLALNALLDWALYAIARGARHRALDLDRVGLQLHRAARADAPPDRLRRRPADPRQPGQDPDLLGRPGPRLVRALARPERDRRQRAARAHRRGRRGVRCQRDSCFWAWPWRCAWRSSRSSTFSCAVAGGCARRPGRPRRCLDLAKVARARRRRSPDASRGRALC